MSGPASPESVSSYDGYDFRRLWAGREAVTRIESNLIRAALGGDRPQRLLEAGTGFGRLSPVLAGVADEYVGVDLDPRDLVSIRDRLTQDDGLRRRLLGMANLFHLPFDSRAFQAVVSIRVYHHIRDPAGFLGELGRVLAPGGLLLLSYTPKPTIGTLEQDLRGFLQSRPSGLTWDRSDSQEFGPNPFPIIVPTAERVRRDVRAAGFEVVRELGEGPERVASWFPIQSLHGGAARFPGSFLFPTRFLLARRMGTGGAELPALGSILACPRCRTPTGERPLRGSWTIPCVHCGLEMELRDGVLFAVFLPSGAERWTVDRAPDRPATSARSTGPPGGGVPISEDGPSRP
jgi:SAM-dependent methyltransferase